MITRKGYIYPSKVYNLCMNFEDFVDLFANFDYHLALHIITKKTKKIN